MKSVEVRLVGRFKLTGKVPGNHEHLLYTASHTQNESTYILKGQQVKNKPLTHFLSILQEGKILQTMQGGIGIPHMQWCGQEEDYNFIVLQELDRSIQVMFDKCGKKFSLKTVLTLGIQIISILQYFHFKNFIHNGINPHHLLLGSGNKFGKIYLIDYSNASRYRDGQTLEHIQESMNKKAQKRNTNLLFTSAHCHKGNSTSRKDDLISLLYMMVYFLDGELPWSSVYSSKKSLDERSKIILEMKESFSNKVFSKYPDLNMLYQYTQSLKFDQKPRYTYYRNVFRQRMQKQGLLQDGIYDWMLLTEDYTTNLQDFELNFEIVPNEQEFIRHLAEEMKSKEKVQIEAMEKKKVPVPPPKPQKNQKDCIIY